MNSIWVSLFEKMEMKRKQKEKDVYIFRSKLLSHEHMNT